MHSGYVLQNSPVHHQHQKRLWHQAFRQTSTHHRLYLACQAPLQHRQLHIPATISPLLFTVCGSNVTQCCRCRKIKQRNQAIQSGYSCCFFRVFPWEQPPFTNLFRTERLKYSVLRTLVENEVKTANQLRRNRAEICCGGDGQQNLFGTARLRASGKSALPHGGTRPR